MSINYEHVITSDTGRGALVDRRNQPALDRPSRGSIKEISGSLLVAFLSLGFLSLMD